jgi:glycosyltransferase involved in cell wall biosynthesis
MLVSIVLPVYNGETSIVPAIQSCLAQTHTALEVIVVNDGSTDQTLLMIERFVPASRVRCFTIPHAGVAHVFNFGISQAKGKYIARMDADDVMHPERLKKQVEFLETHADIGVVSCLVNYGGDRVQQEGYARHVDWINTLTTPEAIALNRFVDSPVCNPSVMFRAELVQQHGGALHGNFPEDYEMWLRWMDGGVQFAKIPEMLFTWNDLPTRITRNDERYSQDAFERAKTDYLVKFIQRNNTQSRPVFICGSGRITRRKSELLQQSHLNIGGFLEIDAAKAGRMYNGIPVLHFDQRPDHNRAYIVNYVSVRGAREQLRNLFLNEGRVEGRDFIMAG